MNLFVLFRAKVSINLASNLTFHYDNLCSLILKQYEKGS